MRKICYFGIFEPNGNNGFSVYFPDLPGCISYGDSFEEAQRNAADALGLHIYGMKKDGDPLPTPSKTPVVDPDTAPGYFISPVTVLSSGDKWMLDLREKLLTSESNRLNGEKTYTIEEVGERLKLARLL